MPRSKLVGFLEEDFVEFGDDAGEISVDDAMLLGSGVQRRWNQKEDISAPIINGSLRF